MSCSQFYGIRGTLLSTPTSRASAIGECSNSTSSASEISSSGILGFTHFKEKQSTIDRSIKMPTIERENKRIHFLYRQVKLIC